MRATELQNLPHLPQISGAATFSAHELKSSLRVASGHSVLDQVFLGGLALEGIHEWGLPMGYGGYGLLFFWLSRLVAYYDRLGKKVWCLWTRGDEVGGKNQKSHDYNQSCGAKSFQIYPPYLGLWGIPLERSRFAKVENGLQDVLPVFASSLFDILVCLPHQKILPADFNFIAARLREQRKTLFVIRSFFLTPQLGNSWAKTRLNGILTASNQLEITAIKGLRPGKAIIDMRSLTK